MKYLLLGWLCFTALAIQAQDRYLTKTGHIWFMSETSLEKIEAHNHQVNCALDIKTGDVAIRVLIKSFEFKKALMQEHFNENYMESHKYPTSMFVGKVLNISLVNLNKDGVYDIIVEGDLTMHGVTLNVREKAIIEVRGAQLLIKSSFIVALADYNIRVPRAVIRNIAENINVYVDLRLEKVKK